MPNCQRKWYDQRFRVLGHHQRTRIVRWVCLDWRRAGLHRHRGRMERWLRARHLFSLYLRTWLQAFHRWQILRPSLDMDKDMENSAPPILIFTIPPTFFRLSSALLFWCCRFVANKLCRCWMGRKHDVTLCYRSTPSYPAPVVVGIAINIFYYYRRIVLPVL